MFGHVKLFCILILSILKFNTCLSNDTIGCDSVEDFQDFANREPLDLGFEGDIQTFSDVKIISIVPPQNKAYIDARLDIMDDHVDLIIFTTENFKRYVYEQTSMHIAFDVIFECPDGKKRTLIFYQPLKEGNYFSPEFSKDVYTFSIPTPLYKGFELTLFEEISAIDYDLMGNTIDFSSTDSEDFKISTMTLKSDWKTSFVSLKTMAILLSVKENFEFTIIATDAGNPPRNSSSKVIITADSSNSLPPNPRFLKTVQYASLTANLQLFEQEIILDPATYSTDVSFRKIADDDDIFKIENINNVVYVNLNRELDLQFLKGKERLTFEVEATNSRLTESGRTAIMISFPEKKELYFKKQLYEGKLFVKSNLLEIEDFEVQMGERELISFQFELVGEHSHLFDATHNQNVVKLSLKPNISADMWVAINYFSLKLLAKVNSDESASTNIIIDAIHTILYFNKPAYKGLINTEGKLVLDPIVLLSNAATTDDFDIKLLQDDEQLFSYVKLGNEIELKLEGNLSISDLKKSYLSLEVEAKEISTGVKASCFVFIEKPVKINVLKFEKTIYEAQISNEAKSITQEVVLDNYSYDDGIEFTLLGPNALYFNFQQNQNILTLSLKEDFKFIDHPEINALWVELKALNARDKLEASAVAIFTIIQETLPEFEEPNYIGELTEENLLKLGKLVLKRLTWKTYTLINLTGVYSKFFDYTVNDNEITISLKSELSDEIKLHNSVVLVATASNNAMKGYSTVVINLPQSRNLSNIFREPIQKGNILEDGNMQVLKIDDIKLAKEYNVADFTCKLSGDESNYIDHALIVPKNIIKLILAEELPSDIIQIKLYMTFLLECQNKDDSSISGSTVIFLSLPGSNGSHNCPIPDPPTFIPEFQKTFYSFYAKPTYVGSLQSVYAIIRESDAGISYSLHVDDEHLRSRINIDSVSGEISLSSMTSPGRYYFDVIAENVVTHSQAQAKGRLDIEAILQCEDHMSVSNSLLIKYVEEETDHNDILSAKLGNCEFYVFSIEPHDREYVKIDPASKMLTMIPTDREDPIFAKMFLPQVEVKLKLDCSNETTTLDNFNFLSRSLRDLRQLEPFVENRSTVLTNDILFAKDVTVLSLMLVDINDNYPEFVYPKHERLVVGFPKEDISMQIFSEYLIQVVALDQDDGLNAKIRYSIQPNEHFHIDHRNGEVYPYANAMKGINEIDLIVYAVDRNGASDGLRSKFTMCVKVLKREHFTLLTFINEDAKNIDTLLESARNKTGIDIIAVKHATLSSTGKIDIEDVGKFRTGSAQFIQKVWIYAFEEGVPIPSKHIKEKFSQDSNDRNISAQTLDEVMNDSVTEVVDLTCIQNVTGYIAGLCVLAVLVVVCIGFILWMYKHENLAHNEKTNNLSSRGPTNQNFNLKQGAEINIQKQTELLGTTTQESTDDGKRRHLAKLNSSLNGHNMQNESDGHESDSSNESMRPRATVTFNELVERIHIESDDEEKNKSR